MHENFKHPDPLRYNIALKLAALEVPVRKRIKRRVQKEMRVSESTVSRWIHVRKSHSADIPALALKTFAFCLNTSLEELFNEDKL